MRFRIVAFAIGLTLFWLWGKEATGGTFLGILQEVNDGNVIPYAITHPPGYSGAGGEVVIDICINEDFLESKRLVGSLQAAIETWNSLTPTVGNCVNCITWEEVPGAGAFDSESVLLHELGHCAMGLGHTNMESGTPYLYANSSLTASYGAVSVNDSNGVPGDYDDIQNNAASIHDFSWFRVADNDPVKIDSTKIDLATLSRSTAADLPSGHGYAANANRHVAESLGFMNTQSVMYSRGAPLQKNRHLSADDVNIVKMGMAGADFFAGPPNDADDYSVRLQYRSACDAEVEIEVGLFPLEGTIGTCYADIALSFPQGGILKWHWTVVPTQGSSSLLINLNKDFIWDFGDRVYASGFENGDFSDWSASAP